MAGQLPTEDNPSRLPARGPSRSNSTRPTKRQHQTTMRRRGIGPDVSERFEAGPFFPDRPQQVPEIAIWVNEVVHKLHAAEGKVGLGSHHLVDGIAPRPPASADVFDYILRPDIFQRSDTSALLSSKARWG
jgi:hypothetical protein